jgi:hypothetical protein
MGEVFKLLPCKPELIALAVGDLHARKKIPTLCAVQRLLTLLKFPQRGVNIAVVCGYRESDFDQFCKARFVRRKPLQNSEISKSDSELKNEHVTDTVTYRKLPLTAVIMPYVNTGRLPTASRLCFRDQITLMPFRS